MVLSKTISVIRTNTRAGVPHPKMSGIEVAGMVNKTVPLLNQQKQASKMHLHQLNPLLLHSHL